MGLGFTPLYAAGLALIANTAPGRVRRDRHADSDARSRDRTAGQHAERDGRPPTAVRVGLIIPVWLVVTMSGWRGLAGVWPAVLVSGGVFAVAQFAWSNFVGPELVDIVGGLLSLGALTSFCRVWKPREVWLFPEERGVRWDPCARPTVSGSAEPGAIDVPPGVACRGTGDRASGADPRLDAVGHSSA